MQRRRPHCQLGMKKLHDWQVNIRASVKHRTFSSNELLRHAKKIEVLFFGVCPCSGIFEAVLCCLGMSHNVCVSALAVNVPVLCLSSV